MYFFLLMDDLLKEVTKMDDKLDTNGVMGSVKLFLTFPAHDLKILWGLGCCNAAIWFNFFLHLIQMWKETSQGWEKKYRTSCVQKCLIMALWTNGWCVVSTHQYSSPLTCIKLSPLTQVGYLGGQEPSLLHQQLLWPHWHMQVVGTNPRQAVLQQPSC